MCGKTAKIDTAADYSLISKSVVEELSLSFLPLTEDDPIYLILPDSGNFPLAGKVSVRLHGINPQGPRLAFKFGKYEYVATFYVPEVSDISCFDTYIGTDNIHKLQLRKRNFFSLEGVKKATKSKPLSELANAMEDHNRNVADWQLRRDNAANAGRKFKEKPPPLPRALHDQLLSERRTKSGCKFTDEDVTWANTRPAATGKSKKEKSGKSLKEKYVIM